MSLPPALPYGGPGEWLLYAHPCKQGARGKRPPLNKVPLPIEEHLGSRGLEWVESEARKLDSRLKRDMQIFIGLNKQPSKLQLQRGWRWGRTWLAPVSISKVLTM